MIEPTIYRTRERDTNHWRIPGTQSLQSKSYVTFQGNIEQYGHIIKTGGHLIQA